MVRRSIYLSFIVIISLMLTIIPLISALPFSPACTFHETPSAIMSGWNESFDGGNLQQYCLYNSSTFFVSQQVGINRLGEPFTSTNADLFYPFQTLLTETGNVRDVKIEFDYYFPNYIKQDNSTVCMANNLNGVTGFYNSPQLVLLANHQQGFPDGIDFDASLFEQNGLVTSCDTWEHFSMLVQDFINDFGSSFSGTSKNIGTFGFEFKNVYIRNVTVTGSTQTFNLF